jgi:hypothetical protein
MTASILRLAVLGLVLTVAQGTNPEPADPTPADPETATETAPPPVETRVPATMTDSACNSGERQVVKVFRNGKLVRTERRGCVT